MLRTYIPFYKRLIGLATPLILTQVGQMTVQLVDTAMIGRVGTTELAAASFSNSIYVVIMLFGLGIFLGVTPLVAHARGAMNDLRVAVLIRNGFMLSGLLLGGIIFAAWSVSWGMPYMGQTPQVIQLSLPYYRILVISTIPFLLFILLKQIGEGLGNTLIAMIAAVVANGINVVLNYILIFGKLGFPPMGLLGAGYATLISRISMALLLYFGFRMVQPIKRYFVLVRAAKTSIAEIKNIFRIGFPIAIQLVLEVTAFSFSAVMMGWLGEVPLASHQAAMGLATFTFMISNALGMATTIRVSFQLGTRDFESLEKVPYSAVHLAGLYMGFCGLGFLVFRNQLPKIFTHDGLVIDQAASLLAIAALFQLFDGIQVVCLGILRGFTDVKIPMLISGFSYIGIGLSVSYLCAFAFKMGPEGIWYGFLAGLMAAATLLYLRIRKKIGEVHTPANHRIP